MARLAIIPLICVLSGIALSESVIDERTRNQAALAYYEQGDFAQAAALFTDLSWKADALVRSNQLRGAQAILSQIPSSDALYNLGVVYAQQGLLELALDAFERVVEIETDSIDAVHNIAVISAMLNKNDDNGASTQSERQDGAAQRADEQQGGGGGASEGDESSSPNNASGERGQSSDTDQASDQRQQSREDQREGGRRGGDNSATLQGNVGQFKSQTSRVATSQEPDDDIRDAAPISSADNARDLDAQAVEQWFNRLESDDQAFMRERFRLMADSRPDVRGEVEIK